MTSSPIPDVLPLTREERVMRSHRASYCSSSAALDSTREWAVLVLRYEATVSELEAKLADVIAVRDMKWAEAKVSRAEVGALKVELARQEPALLLDFLSRVQADFLKGDQP